LRTPVVKAFDTRVVKNWRARIEAVTTTLRDAVQHDDVIDVVPSLAYPLPITMISEMLGLAPEDATQLKAWTNAVAAFIDREQAGRVLAPACRAAAAVVRAEDAKTAALDDDPSSQHEGRAPREIWRPCPPAWNLQRVQARIARRYADSGPAGAPAAGAFFAVAPCAAGATHTPRMPITTAACSSSRQVGDMGSSPTKPPRRMGSRDTASFTSCGVTCTPIASARRPHTMAAVNGRTASASWSKLPSRRAHGPALSAANRPASAGPSRCGWFHA
jgi:hypothetical protein